MSVGLKNTLEQNRSFFFHEKNARTICCYIIKCNSLSASSMQMKRGGVGVLGLRLLVGEVLLSRSGVGFISTSGLNHHLYYGPSAKTRL